MRVALVIERFEPRGGGVEAVAWNVASALAARGADVHVIARQASRHDRATLHPVRVPTFWQPLRVLAFSRAAAREAAAGHFDVIHTFSRTRHQHVFRAGGGSHADYLARSHGALGRRLRRISPRHAVLLTMERAVFRDESQTIQCNSQMVRDELARRHAVPDERLVVIPNGVDLDRFHPRRRETGGRRLREALEPSIGKPLEPSAGSPPPETPPGPLGGSRPGLPNGTPPELLHGTRPGLLNGTRPIWLFAGSGFRRKGLEVALRALALSAGCGLLWVAGRDDPRPWQRRAAELGVGDRVRFLGNRDDLEDVYAATDALLLPTRYDAFANVCLEALASGLPVVTSGANGAAALVADAGIVIEDPEDAAGFAKALDRLDPAARAAAAVRARPIAERYGWDAHATGLLDLYRRIA